MSAIAQEHINKMNGAIFSSIFNLTTTPTFPHTPTAGEVWVCTFIKTQTSSILVQLSDGTTHKTLISALSSGAYKRGLWFFYTSALKPRISMVSGSGNTVFQAMRIL